MRPIKILPRRGLNHLTPSKKTVECRFRCRPDSPAQRDHDRRGGSGPPGTIAFRSRATACVRLQKRDRLYRFRCSRVPSRGDGYNDFAGSGDPAYSLCRLSLAYDGASLTHRETTDAHRFTPMGKISICVHPCASVVESSSFVHAIFFGARQRVRRPRSTSRSTPTLNSSLLIFNFPLLPHVA